MIRFHAGSNSTYQTLDYTALSETRVPFFCLLEPPLFKRFILLPYITTLKGKNVQFNHNKTFFVFFFLAFILKSIQSSDTQRSAAL